MLPDTEDDLVIAALGARGDGVAEMPDGPCYVPFALPGERVLAEGEGVPRLVSAPSPDRVHPSCRHFGHCGGCVAQHMGDRLYAEWKRDIVVGALRSHGLEPPAGPQLAPLVAPLQRVPAGSRRRAVLTARRAAGRIALGYHRRRSNALIDIEECPVLCGEIVAALPALREIAALLPAPELRLTVLQTPAGLDLHIEPSALAGTVKGGTRGGPAGGSPRGKGAPAISRDAAAAMARIAAGHGVARVSVGSDTLVELARPVLPMGAAEVAVPPGAFVQAVRESEEIMRGLVLAALAGAAPGAKTGARTGARANPKRVADLFCGVGTFTLALARRAQVLALDSDAAAVAALNEAARHAQGVKPIVSRVRDLFREPLSPRELQPYDAVILDPPRAGAQAQARELARSEVGTVVVVSCDPGTLARDAQILTSGGYTLTDVTPIDQFVYAAHVETVAVLRRLGPGLGPGRRGRPGIARFGQPA